MRRQRVSTLERAVQESPGFEEWQADYSRNSFKLLGAWFERQVSTRPRTPQELAQKSQGPIPEVASAPWELTNETFSWAIDVGLYFGESLQKRYPSLKWEQDQTDKRSADFGQAVLVGFGSVPLNPISIMVTLAYGIAKRERTGDRLSELHSLWDQLAAQKALSP